MLPVFRFFLIFFSCVTLAVAEDGDGSEVVVRDGSVTITRAEFEAALERTPDRIKRFAARDVGDRLEFINNLVQIRKLAAVADTYDVDDERYWDLQFQLLATKRQFAFNQELGQFVVPDVQGLLREYYDTQRDKYALVPETRASSHILLSSPPGQPRDEVRAKARRILDQLRNGADFEALVQEHSDDRSSKRRNGSLNRYIRFGEPEVTPPYSEALFEIEEVGGYSGVTDSQFGVHIIRLDDIRESRYKSFEEVRDVILQDIIADYRKKAAAAISRRYNISDEAFIDGDAMDEIFSAQEDR